MYTTHLNNEQATLRLGQSIARFAQELGVIFLQGELGAGKTTLVRGILRGLNHPGFVKSPSYTIVEPYLDARKPVYHFDLYRIADPQELEYVGLRDYLLQENLCIFEWPEHAAGTLPKPDLLIKLDFDREGRVAHIMADTEYGKYALEQLEKIL
jgi:tRNA threonylcarbamoyladenosine biosynthesis protein TsaE